MSKLVMESKGAVKVLSLARRVAEFNIPVLIQGETGTGKECVAKYIHAHAFPEHQDAPYIGVNCAAIPENMLESTLFGYEKGAFTGAVNAVPGKFELANNGTLLLDEVGDMPVELQAKLLRVLQEHQVERLGGHRSIKLNFRLIACTNKDLEQEVAAGRFREDLYYRLAVVPITLPPLRERREDIIPLALSFIEKYASMLGREIILSDSARSALLSYSWPGNIRQLENIIQRGMIMNRNGVIYSEMLGIPTRHSDIDTVPAPQPRQYDDRIQLDYANDLKKHGRHAQYQYIADLMQKYQGNKSRIAELLGITPRALRYRLASMREQGIDVCF